MIPRATYRLQFHKDFPFEAAIPLGSYLRRLGISHAYASPILKARAGSQHGYDVIDPSEINPELGGERAFRELSAELRKHGLGIILDIVPNHMAVSSENRWWMDVLEHGRGSRFAGYFDIDWQMLDGKVLTAFLGKPYWETLQAGEIEIVKETSSGKLCAKYFDWRLPLRPEDQDLDPANFRAPDALHVLLESQHWRLAWWRTANDIINWRRFFDVPDLIALNQDNKDVFEATHAKVLELYRDGLIDGVRVDHVDGLADPAGYCRQLRARLDALAKYRSEPDSHPYIVVEKILGAGEKLPDDWGVDGTTGYDFTNAVSAVEHDPRGAELLTRFWHEVSGRPEDFDCEERLARSEIVRGSFESALSRTTDIFFSLAQTCRQGRDVTHAALRRGLVQLLQSLRVYRTYANNGEKSASSSGRLDQAALEAERLAGASDRAAISWIASVFSCRTADMPPQSLEAVRRFNQLSAPVAAKAVEDTAFYRYGRLLSRNDVGFDPSTFASSAADFHAQVTERVSTFPNALLATATHDHKRGEDVRARLAVLSEIPEEWERATRAWMNQNAPHRVASHDRGAEYQLYQVLVGAWPLELRPDDEAGLAEFRDRILAWRLKALREAKLQSSWLDPNETHEQADAGFVRNILNFDVSSSFLRSLMEFVSRIAPGGALNGLVQSTLRCTVPGVPDCYQGTEFWDFSLVDPDNRRPVDYAARIGALDTRQPMSELLGEWRDGRVKQRLIAALLALRQRQPQLFSHGTYVPLISEGRRDSNVLAFARFRDEEALMVAVPLHCASACAERPMLRDGFWEDTRVHLPEEFKGRRWKNVFDADFREDGENISCSALFARFPIAVLTL
jgi:(1->4)-alpha-D-glucan 1-alpha-D-glucosylmutase